MELFYQNIRKEGRRDGAVLSEQEGGQERWSCFIRT